MLAKALHRDIVALGKRMENAASTDELTQTQHSRRRRPSKQQHAKIAGIIRDIKHLLARIDSDVPLLQLAITASGESLSTALPPGISPSRLLQASMLLVMGDTQFSSDPSRPVQIGPSFTLSLYMLFLGHSSSTNALSQTTEMTEQSADPGASVDKRPYGVGSGERKPIWQEVLHKMRVRICRTPLGWEFCHGHGFAPASRQAMHHASAGEITTSSRDPSAEQERGDYAYHLEMIEDLDDGRAHEVVARDTAYDSMQHTGVQEAIPIYQISKLFYTDSGRILNIGTANDFENTSVLLLKRDTTVSLPSKTTDLTGSPADDVDPKSPKSSFLSSEQDEVDRQLREESSLPGDSSNEQEEADKTKDHHWRLPGHLDPDWLALEVYADDGDDRSEDDNEESNVASDSSEEEGEEGLARPKQEQHSWVATGVEEQMHNMSIADNATSSQRQAADSRSPNRTQPRCVEPPFGSVLSLSLLEMLIRLTSLQQFQQTSHLSIPDHILTFFLEETSATGLRGEERQRAKRAAEQRMGFDPFTDRPISATKDSEETRMQEKECFGLHESPREG